ncbi:hypothetical protein LZ198_05580 [Myxococcus sp. K15C18031901]|uniref:hypothetical protein n=1 Tax=Myxococcus dinghuensis TaxID=2906761 RepID=UPI0020A71128|nr:hypothetical protein [Myxococcus dinghuensis]MCP3098349.1 hypothetical protein [Myxococcus dinghuensis]
MGRVASAVVLAVALSGCATVKVEQRDGCWVKQTRSFLSRVKEEVGPCARPKPEWSEDRLTRLVQECVMHADYRWQSSAMVAWNRGEPLPERESDEKVLDGCLATAEKVLATDKGEVEAQLTQVSEERDALLAKQEKEREANRARMEQEREEYQQRLKEEREESLAVMAEERERYQSTLENQRESTQSTLDQMHESNLRMADALGEAAKKPAPNAYATASSTSASEGQASTRGEPPPVNVSSGGDTTKEPDATPAPGPQVAKPTLATTLCALKSKDGKHSHPKGVGTCQPVPSAPSATVEKPTEKTQHPIPNAPLESEPAGTAD